MDARKNPERKRNPGAILSALDRAARWIYRKTEESVIGSVMTSYDRESASVEKSLTARLSNTVGVSRRFFKPVKRRIASAFESSAIFGFIKSRLDALLSCSMRVWGVFTLSMALYTALVWLIRRFALGGEDIVSHDIMSLYIAGAIALVSFPMLGSSKTLAATVCESRFASFAVFRVAGVRRESFEREREPLGRSNIAFIAGMALGLCTFFVSPLYIILGLIGVIAAYMVLITPEIGVVAAIFITPFSTHSMPLALLTVYITVCYLIKLLLGKRTLHFELCDAAVLFFMVTVFLGGLFSVAPSATFKPAMLLVCFICGYFLVVNLIRTSEWVARSVGALAISSFFVAAYGLYENFFGTVETTWQDTDMFSEIEGRVVSTFGNPNVLAEFLIMTIPFAAAVFLVRNGAATRLAAFAMFASGAGCLIYTWSRGAWLGFMFAALIFIILYDHRSIILVFFGMAAIPFLPFVLPDSIISRFTSIGSVSDSSTSYRIHIWEACCRMAADFWTGGIGVGEGAFAQVYPKYTLAGIESAPHSHNLYLQILLETGIVGLVAFLIVIFLFVQSCITFIKHKSDYPEPAGMSAARISCLSGLCGIIAILVQGMTDYVWYNYRVFFIFWLVTGLTLAVRRSALAEYTEPQPEPYSLELELESSDVKKSKIKKSAGRKR